MLPMLVLMFVISSTFHLNLNATHLVLYNLCRICDMGLIKINITCVLCQLIPWENF